MFKEDIIVVQAKLAEEWRDRLIRHLFAFINRRGNQMKVLYFDHNSLCVWSKRLEQGRLIQSWQNVASREMDFTALKLLLEGIEPKRVHKRYQRPFGRLTQRPGSAVRLG